MRMAATLIFILLAAELFAGPANAASRLGESCDLSVLGVGDTTDFYRFDNTLREAVTARDAAALAPLVDYPVRLNYKDGGHVEVHDAAALRERYAGGLWPVLQDAVIGQQPGELFCNADGVMYGDGTVWVNLVGRAAVFRITALNLPGHAPAQGTPAEAAAARAAGGNKVLLACDTNKFHIVIDAGADDQPRYRSWNQPNLPPADPAMNLIGDESREGTGMCSHRIWHFRNGNTDYVVSEPGCTNGEVPSNAKAQLTVQTHGRTQLESWCH